MEGRDRGRVMGGRSAKNAITSLAVLSAVVICLASCDPPEPTTTLDGQAYRTTCTAVPLSKLGGGIREVTAGPDVSGVRRIGGVDPRDAFAVAHDNPGCPEEAPGEWLLTYRVDLSRARVDVLKERVRASLS